MTLKHGCGIFVNIIATLLKNQFYMFFNEFCVLDVVFYILIVLYFHLYMCSICIYICLFIYLFLYAFI